jgi:hypothetical protein
VTVALILPSPRRGRARVPRRLTRER